MDYSGESSDRKEESYTEASIISENTYIIMNKKLVEIWMLVVSAELSESNEKYIIGNWRKGILGYKVAENLV